jgi:hypothetical protein
VRVIAKVDKGGRIIAQNRGEGKRKRERRQVAGCSVQGGIGCSVECWLFSVQGKEKREWVKRSEDGGPKSE